METWIAGTGTGTAALGFRDLHQDSVPLLLARISLSSRVAERMRKTLQSSSSVKVFARFFMRLLRLLAFLSPWSGELSAASGPVLPSSTR